MKTEKKSKTPFLFKLIKWAVIVALYLYATNFLYEKIGDMTLTLVAEFFGFIIFLCLRDNREEDPKEEKTKKSVPVAQPQKKKKRSLFGPDPVVENMTNRVMAKQFGSPAQYDSRKDDANERMRRRYNAENEARYQQYQYEKRAYRYPNSYDTQEAKNRAARARSEANKW